MPQEPTEQTRNNFREDEGLAAQLTQVVTHSEHQSTSDCTKISSKDNMGGTLGGGGGPDTWHS